MKKQWLPVIGIMTTLILGGCAGSMESVSDYWHAGPLWQAAQSADIVARARDLEARGELNMALDHWRLVRRIATNQAEAGREIHRLEDKIAKAVQSHYRLGLSALKTKQPTAARNHFLTALRLDPTFKPALRQIKARFSPFPLAVFLSVSGDRASSVAQKVFGDKKKAFLVAWFNDLPDDREIKPGTVLILPKLETMPPHRVSRQRVPDRLAEARVRLSGNDFDGALALANQADPTDPDVQALIDTIHLQQATQQIDSGLLEDARLSLSKVPDGVAGKAMAMRALTEALHQRQISRDLAAARSHFDRGEYQQCLDQVEALLERAPDNLGARDLAAEARYRMALAHVAHQRYLLAREVLDDAKADHAASAALKETVRMRLVENAQTHYRNGVKHFINENLQSAIAEWEKALICDPDHAKASENIENARRLLDKIERLP